MHKLLPLIISISDILIFVNKKWFVGLREGLGDVQENINNKVSRKDEENEERKGQRKEERGKKREDRGKRYGIL